MTSKILTHRTLPAVLRRLRSRGRKIVFTNGTFDILHAGHVRYLQAAKRAGDILSVGVNTDRSVRTYKDPGRPVNKQSDRLFVLAALECVDFVILFSEPTPLKLIKKIQPQVLVKGADWKIADIVGAQEVQAGGGMVKRIRFLKGRSTTGVIEKVLNAYTKKRR